MPVTRFDERLLSISNRLANAVDQSNFAMSRLSSLPVGELVEDEQKLVNRQAQRVQGDDDVENLGVNRWPS